MTNTNAFPRTLTDAAHPHGLWAGDRVVFSRGTVEWTVSAAFENRIIVTRRVPAFRCEGGWRTLRRDVEGTKLDTLRIVSR